MLLKVGRKVAVLLKECCGWEGGGVPHSGQGGAGEFGLLWLGEWGHVSSWASKRNA